MMDNDNDVLLGNGSLADLAREFLGEGDDSARAYLIQGWLATTMSTLRDARRRAQLTQEEVARRLGTTQSAIARLEKDHDGRCSLQRYIEYLAACDALPLTIETAPLTGVSAYALAFPDAPRTVSAYQAWCKATAKIAMLEMPHRSGTTDVQLEVAEDEEDKTRTSTYQRPSLSILHGGLAEPSEAMNDTEALAV